ncbi:peroxin 11C like [Lecanosticta acicola]|uniref:Peroxin 11C like n=1 Tax=Lecanosticta acicola TaxID=111012 RepID=A0AAI9E7Z1_9PEZI|nr:peroxin 11C like [Lecanosticta acicola]
MSDPVVEKPGAPAETPRNIPPPSDKSIAAKVHKEMPNKVTGALATPDRILLRLNKLLAAPGGLSAFLSTFNYTLYLLTHLEAKAAPLQERLFLLLNRNAALPKVTPVTPAGPSRFAALAALLSQTRVTLRLFGLLPLYAWARQLAQGPKPGQDHVLYTCSVAQCGLYIAFQFLENVALLSDNAVIPAQLTARWTEKTGGKATKIYLTAYRAWMLGFSIDFVRLLREAQLERNKRSQRSSVESKDVSVQEEDKKIDQQWWQQLIVPAAWFPVGWQSAEWNEGGFPGFSLGLMGACGAIAGLDKTKALWDATA